MISNFLNLVTLVPCFTVQSIMENIPCALEKHENSLVE